MSRIFEFAVVYQPNEQHKEDGEKARIIVSPTVVLAEDQAVVQITAARAIPDSFLNQLDEVEIAVRPF